MSELGGPRSGMRVGNKREDGASLLEFAVAMPLLLLLVLGIIEFGFVLAQMNEIRHGAREGARYAAVSRPDYDVDGTAGDNADVLAATCDSVVLPGVTTTVALSFVDSDGAPGANRLEYGTVTVVADTESLSGFPLISAILPDTLTNEARFRLEQDAGWGGFGPTSC
jgi:Flp pilus assembly protein TadG